MRFDIERALPPDAAGLARLHAQALPPGWPAADFAASCGDANRSVFKAVHGARLLGLAILQWAADEAEILSIAVDGQASRRGIASSLMEAALGVCRQKLISCIFLEVAEGNGPARKFYDKFGFRLCGRRKDYYWAGRPAPENALILRLDINCGLSHIDREKSRA